MNRMILFAAAACVVTSLGCAEGPMHHWGHLNPWVVQKWDEENSVALGLQAKRENIRRLAKVARGRDDAKAEEAVATLSAILAKEELPLARIEAAIALGNARRDSAAAALETALKDKEVEVRIAACDALGKQANPVSVPVLQDMLTNEVERDVQLAAARALGNIPDPAAVEALAVALDQRSPALQYRAMESLRSITGEDFDGDVDQWRTYAKGDIKIDRNGPSFAKGLGQLFR